MPYDPTKHGRADYGKFMQIPESSLSAIIEEDSTESYDPNARYAIYTYNVAPTTLNLSGDIAIDSVGIDGTGLVKISGDQLKVFDQGTIDAINNSSSSIIASLSEVIIDKNFSRVVQERNCDSYFAHAPVGTSLSETKWRVYKLDEYGNRTWAGGGPFNQQANIELSGLTYNY